MRNFGFIIGVIPAVFASSFEERPSFKEAETALEAALRELELDSLVSPDLDTDEEEYSPAGELILGENLSVGDSSVVHVAEVVADNDWSPPPIEVDSEVIVKYMDDCRLRNGEIESIYGPPLNEKYVQDAFLNEYLMLKILNPLKLTPQIYFLSDATVLDPSIEFVPERMQSSYLGRNFAACAAKHTNIRYMIMEKVGPSVAKYMDWLQGEHSLYGSTEFARRVLVITQKVMQLLKRLHEFGVVHGDIHFGNIAFRRTVDCLGDLNVDSDELVLLDFEYATFIPTYWGKPVEDHPVTRARLQHLRPELLSPWQLKNQRPGARDDVYRLLLVAAYWLSRTRFGQGYQTLLKKRLELHGNPSRRSAEHHLIRREVTEFIRGNSPLFTYSSILGSRAIIGYDNLVPSANQDQIRERLEDLHGFITVHNHPDTIIDYAHIDRELELTLALFQSPSN